MQKKRLYVAVVVLTFVLLSLSGCISKDAEVFEDVVTQKVAETGRIPVTILVKNAFAINSFEEKAEKKFPELDIIQVGNYTSNMGTAEYEARLKNDDLTDVVMTWPLNVGKEYLADRLIDLSAQPFTGRYNVERLDRVAQDGKLYYLPGPSQVRGIVYNKTMFNENGWTVPTDFDGFLALCDEIEATGIKALQLGLGNEEVLDTAFVGYSLSDCFSKPSDLKAFSEYNEGNGSFADNFTPALNTFQKLIDRKILKPEDLKITYSDREYMLFNRQCAMVEDSVLLARMGKNYNGCTDEFGLMPFFNPGAKSDWARLYPVCYIGLNKHLEEPKNKEKYDIVLQLMDYISSSEGQLALGGDTGAMFSSLNGMPPPDIPEIVDIIPALKEGRYSIFPVLKNAQGALRSGLAGMVDGKLTAGDVVRMVDTQNVKPPVHAPMKSIGQATEKFSLIETGNFITDAMRKESGCEIALFLDNGKDGRYNGKGVSAKIYKGDITAVDLGRILPDLRQNESGTMWRIEMTGKELLNTLEYSITVDNNRSGWFYYFSGLRMKYAPVAEPGTRIRSITTTEGKEIDPKQIYSVAVMDHTVSDDIILTKEETGILISDILKRTISKGSISPSGDGRFTVVDGKTN